MSTDALNKEQNLADDVEVQAIPIEESSLVQIFDTEDFAGQKTISQIIVRPQTMRIFFRKGSGLEGFNLSRSKHPNYDVLAAAFLTAAATKTPISAITQTVADGGIHRATFHFD